MTNTSVESSEDIALDETQIIEYLEQNPDIFTHYPEVLASLNIPHQSGSATSLVERQIKILRDDNRNIRAKLDELVGIARDNEELNQRFHRLSLELMKSDQLYDVIAMVQDQVQTFFYTDFVCFRFLPNIKDKKNILQGHHLDADSGIVDTVLPWIDKRDPICGSLDDKINLEIFGTEFKIGSSALIPLFHTESIGLLCLGSTSSTRFTRSMGTIFLKHLGELVSTRLQGLLNH
jgi:uncharacterized protein YigA (DUF484 family)